MTPSEDPRAVLVQLVVRLRAAAPADRVGVVRQLLPLLANPGVPLAVRFAAAARALDALPDTPHAIRGVVRALTARASPARSLARLRHLQRLTEKSDSLDALVIARERKVKMSCPRCDARLSRPEMVKHLWHEHGLALVKGKTRTRARMVEAVRREHASTGEPALIDRAVAIDRERAVGPWAAETATEEEAVPLCLSARERGVSLCPACFADVPPQVPELTAVLAVANGRLAGDGFVAKAPVLSPPRVRATLAAVGMLIAFVLVVPVWLALMLSIVTYALTRVFLAPKDTPNDRAIDAAWKNLARSLTDRRDAARFLTRLCVTSIGRGDPFERANALNAVIARARASPAERQLLAVALALQMDDSGRFGRDRAAGVAELVGPAFRGEQPAEFAEFVLAVYLRVPREAAEIARLRALLLTEAFTAELTPREVLDLCDVAPAIAQAVRLSPSHVALMYGVWVNRRVRNWENVGEARTVFEFATAAPTTAGRLLSHEPGLLLVCTTHPDAEAELGPVLVCAGGVSVGGVQTADPAADVRLEANGRTLVFGKHPLRVSGRLPETFPAELKAWLRFRAEVLVGYPAAFLRADAPHTTRLLKPFVARCAACGTECLPVIGEVARPLRT